MACRRPASPLPVVLSFDGITDPAGATVRFAADGGLTLVGTGGPHAAAGRSDDDLTVQVRAGADGIGYLHVFTTQCGATSATSIAGAGRQGAVRHARPANSSRPPDGDKILSMPVK